MTASDKATSDGTESGSAASGGVAGGLSTSERLEPALPRGRAAVRRPLPHTAAFLGRLQRIHAAHAEGDPGRARTLLDELRADLKRPIEPRDERPAAVRDGHPEQGGAPAPSSQAAE